MGEEMSGEMGQRENNSIPSFGEQNNEAKTEAKAPSWFTALKEQPEYSNCELTGLLSGQAENRGWENLCLVCSDIDGTMTYKLNRDEQKLPPEEQMRIKDSYVKALQSATSRLEKKQIPFIAISGRGLGDIRRGQPGGANYQSEKLPNFPVCAEAVGTTIQVLQKDGSYLEDKKWNEYIEKVVGFDRERIYEKGCLPLVEALAKECPELNLQFQPMDSPENVEAWRKNPENTSNTNPVNRPQEKKISFTWEGTRDLVPEMQAIFADMLRTSSVDAPKVKVVISHDRDLGDEHHRFNVDLVPVTKRDAIEYMRQKYGGGDMSNYEVGNEKSTSKTENNLSKGATVIVAGDSGNDEDMIRGSSAGVVVGGAKPELKNAMDELRASPIKVKETAHFIKTGDTQVTYIEPERGELNASRSLDRALHAFELLDLQDHFRLVPEK